MAEAALHDVIYRHLNGAGPWGDRAYPLRIPAGVQRPYLTWFVASGGPDNLRVRVRDATFVLSCKCVADQLAEALEGMRRIEELLADAGELDHNTLPTNPDWMVKTISQDRIITLEEEVDGGMLIYHRGHQYRVVMEKR